MNSRGHGHMYRTYRLGDVLFRSGVALTAAWIYLRTLLVVPSSTDMQAWTVFAWTGWPLVLLIWIGAISTVASYLRER